MKRTFAAAWLIVLLLFGGALLLPESRHQSRGPAGDRQENETKQTSVQDSSVTLKVWDGSKIVEMTMAEYLSGVVRGEMPATFEAQALAAQAVAERTYIYYQMSGGHKEAHPDADICMDHTCCNAWVSEEQAREKWGKNADSYEKKIEEAVQSTDGQVMLYQDRPILAVFHSSSAGVTAGSGDVWTSDLPYLTSVKSPETAESVPNYYSVKTVSAEEFRTTFLAAYPEAELSGETSGWFGEPVENDSGRVESIRVGGVSVEGTEMRALFSLRSACFTVETTEGEVSFHVTGYGHGVGMSQYGANELAKEGKSWQEILAWYYTGVTITDYTR